MQQDRYSTYVATLRDQRKIMKEASSMSVHTRGVQQNDWWCHSCCLHLRNGHNSPLSQDGAHGHQRQRQVQLPPDVLLQGGVAPELAEPDSASFASGAGEAVLLTSTGDDDVIDAQATMHLPSTGMDQ